MGQQRRFELDVFRGIAIILVIICHTGPVPDNQVFNFFYSSGWVGVDIFFVLSGFLVSGLLFKEYLKYFKIDVVRFFIRRGLKILPAFLFFTAASWFLPLSINPASLHGLVCDLLFIQSYCPGIHNHTWSLSVEENFYLLLAFLILILIKKQKIHLLPKISITVLVFCLSARIITTALVPYSWFTNNSPTHLRLDSLMFGTLIAYYYNFKQVDFFTLLKRYRIILMSSSFLLFLPSFIIAKPENAFIHTFGYTLNYLAAGAMLLFLLTTEIPQIMITRIVASIGYQSYSIYLWHITVNVAMIPIALYFNILPDLTAWPRFIIYFVGSVLWGSLMGKFIEKPFLILREKIAQNPLFLFQSKIT